MKSMVIVAGVVLIALALVFSGCGGVQKQTRKGAGEGTVTVGSKTDVESLLLAQMMILMLRDAGFEVIDKSPTGTASEVQEALLAAEIDIYPEYTGNGAFFYPTFLGRETGEADSPDWKDHQKGYERIKKLDRERNNIAWLKPAPANSPDANDQPDDPRSAQFVYAPAPRARTDVVVGQYPEIPKILDPVFESLTTEILQELDSRIAVGGEKPVDVARDYLTSSGFLK